ncbi:MAG: alpha/beta fold hydrolase [Gammaproteobacteria bacterium]|nr:alpha/beta fold hydrolase [Gammaproteobacteria bacterium]
MRRMFAVLFTASSLLAAVVVLADAELPKSRSQALAMEAQDALPLTRFYDPPPLGDRKPGTLIRAEPFNGYSLPPGARAVRILYVSRALDGARDAVSGVVLIPAGSPPRGGWPVIAWAHGTSGVARMCAPSLMKDVEYGSEGLMPMVAAGFAVIATDYAGLGTPGPHPYDNKIAQANDVAYSVPAAHAAVPSLGRRWVAIGHSQGGIAVWGVAEFEARHSDPTYRGAISVAGDMSFEGFEAHDARDFAAITNMYWPLTAFGVKASYPSFDVRRMLSGPMLARYKDMTTMGCWYYDYAVAAEIGAQAAVRPGWNRAAELARYNRDGRSADKAIRGPLMVLAGDDDRSVNFANIKAGVARACRLRLPIEFVHRPGLDHDPLMEKTIGLQLAWTRARLEGRPWRGNCGALRRP